MDSPPAAAPQGCPAKTKGPVALKKATEETNGKGHGKQSLKSGNPLTSDSTERVGESRGVPGDKGGGCGGEELGSLEV